MLERKLEFVLQIIVILMIGLLILLLLNNIGTFQISGALIKGATYWSMKKADFNLGRTLGSSRAIKLGVLNPSDHILPFENGS